MGGHGRLVYSGLPTRNLSVQPLAIGLYEWPREVLSDRGQARSDFFVGQCDCLRHCDCGKDVY